MKTLTIIAPVYNEEEVIERFYTVLKAELDQIKERYDSKILFVMDRGTDGTINVLKKIATSDPSVQVLALSSRFGHQMSLLAGIDHADSDAVVMMDSDLQHPPELIASMLQEFEKGTDIVFTVRENTEKIGFFKKTLSKLFYRCINLMSDTHINENAADFRLVSRRVLKVLQEKIRERNIFLRGLISWIGFKQTALPYSAQERPGGKSKYSLGRRVQLAAHGVFSFSKKPLQASIFLGALFALCSFVFGVATCVQYFLTSSFPSGWATMVILLSGFSGIQLIFLGIVGQYIGNIFDEVKGRPHYLVEEKINIQ